MRIMNNISKYVLLGLVLMWACPLNSAANDPTIIFSNYDTDNTIFMNRLAIQRIFTRKDTRWENGKNILVYIKPIDSIEHRIFVANVLNMTLYRYQKSLETYTYTARALPVTEVNSDDKMRVAVNSHPGAIGYINYELVVNEKTIKIID